MRIAITGATGFLGRQLVAQLSAEHELVCISRGGSAPPECTAKKIDVVNGRGLKAAFAKIDVVIHAAGLVSHDLDRAQDTWAVHVKGTQNVLGAARSAGVKRVVYLSTSGTIAVSADPDFMGTEECSSPDAIIASWPYYRSKRYAEQVALETDDIEIICLNPSLLLGPGDEPGGVSTHSVQVFLDQGVPVAPAGGISFVDVRDVVNAIEASLTRGTPGDRYLLAGGNMRFLEFYSRLARITGRDAPVMSMPSITRRALEWFPKWGRNNGISAGIGPVISRADMELASHFWYADSSKAASELGWTPRGPTETLEDTVSDILDKRERSFQMYR